MCVCVYSLATGSPWHVEVNSADHIVTTAGQLGCLPINTVARFEVNTRDDGDVQVDINGLLKFHVVDTSLMSKCCKKVPKTVLISCIVSMICKQIDLLLVLSFQNRTNQSAGSVDCNQSTYRTLPGGIKLITLGNV